MVRRLKTEIVDWDGNPGSPSASSRRSRSSTAMTNGKHTPICAPTQSCASKRAAGDRAGEFATQFISLLLKKRLFSSPAAFARTLETHRQTITRNRRRPRQSLPTLQAQFDRTEEPQETDDQFEEAVEAAQAAAAATLEALNAEEDAILGRLERLGRTGASNVPDAKAKRLLDLIEGVCRPDGDWSDERIIIFTRVPRHAEVAASSSSPRGASPTAAARCCSYGGQDDEERAEIKAAFQANPAESPVRILLATDSASEGINLQNHCHRLVHYEIPWNPNRMEQRNGRVDRHGQRAARYSSITSRPPASRSGTPIPTSCRSVTSTAISSSFAARSSRSIASATCSERSGPSLPIR